MGTVGLAFGSPTSGAGFNVSSTVAEIVSNLSNVETPWKTQLTSLESQDTVISSLGTLFSNLSNDMSQLTDADGILAEKEGSSSDTSVLELTSATSSAASGTYAVIVNSLATTANGYMDPITKASDALTGSITINGATVDVPDSSTGENSLSGLVSAINSADIGVTASVTTDANGSRLSLESNTSGASGSLSVTSAVDDGSNLLKYNANLAAGANASLSLNGVTYSTASNTVTNLIPGVTFQLLGTSTSGSEVQVVISNDNAGVESTVKQFVSDYNSLVSAINSQEGNTSSGTPEPLFGSPTLSLLQQELLNGINSENPNGYLDSVPADAGVTFSGSITINGTTVDVPGSSTGDNTLSGLVSAINAANASTPVTYTAASGGDSGSMTVSNTAYLSGTLTVQAGDGTKETIYLGPSSDAPSRDLATGSSQNTLSSLASFINGNSTLSGLGITASIPQDNGDGTSTTTLTSSNGALTATSGVEIPGLGVTAGISTSGGESTLTLTSQTAGPSGALTVTSAIKASAPAALSYIDSGYTSATADSGALGSAASSSDALSGSVTVQVGSGNVQNIDMSTVNSVEGGTTLSDLQQYIHNNSATLGFTASPVTNSDGSSSLLLTSNTDGSTGALTVTSNLYDTANPSVTTLDYTNSSDINNLSSLGISVNNDGSLTFDASSLDSVLNSDYASVVGFFQNADSWGQKFSNMLTNSGSSSPTGILGLATTANSTTESTLNADISKEQSYISAQQSSLTTELNQANEILEELPSQLQGINELYSAVTGYDQNTNG